MLQDAAWFLTLAMVGAVSAAFVWVAVMSRDPADYPPIVAKAYALRKVLFVALLTVAGAATALTLGRLPYGHAGEAGAAHVIDAVAYQWYWELSDDQATVGVPVEFRVTAQDVTHGFGVYDEDLNLVAQTQAMPGYTNVLRHVFKEPGTYRILCLEYCGLSHHAMIAELVVAAN